MLTFATRVRVCLCLCVCHTACSEDGTIKMWHSTTYRLETTLDYRMERVWGIGYLKVIVFVCVCVRACVCVHTCKRMSKFLPAGL